MGAYVWGAHIVELRCSWLLRRGEPAAPFYPRYPWHIARRLLYTHKKPYKFLNLGRKTPLQHAEQNPLSRSTGLPIFSFKLQIFISPPEWRKEKQRYGKKVQVRGSSITKSPWQGSFMTMWRISLQKGFCQWVMTSGINNGDCWCFDLSLMSLCA